MWGLAFLFGFVVIGLSFVKIALYNYSTPRDDNKVLGGFVLILISLIGYVFDTYIL